MTEFGDPTQLDNFFEAKHGAAPVTAPPPPAGVDRRDFKSATSGGFGNFSTSSTASTASGATGGPANMLTANIGAMLQNVELPAGVRSRWEAHFGTELRPWQEFAIGYIKPETAQVALGNAQQNFMVFRKNYLLLLAVYVSLNLLSSFSCVMLLIGLGGSWYKFLQMNDDPEWQPMIAGISLGPAQRFVAACGISALLIFMISGSLIFSSCLFFSFIAFLHGAFHKVSEEALAAAMAGPEGGSAPIGAQTV